jgi:hypothetical protein
LHIHLIGLSESLGKTPWQICLKLQLSVMVLFSKTHITSNLLSGQATGKSGGTSPKISFAISGIASCCQHMSCLSSKLDPRYFIGGFGPAIACL